MSGNQLSVVAMEKKGCSSGGGAGAGAEGRDGDSSTVTGLH